MNWLKNIFKGNDRSKRLSKADEANAFFAPIVESKTLTPIEVNINLENDEQCYYIEDNVRLAEPRAIRHSKYGSYSARVIKWLWVHTGEGVSESVDTLRIADAGRLYLTNRRIIFLEDIKTLSIGYEDILANRPMTTAINLCLANNKNKCLFVNNPAIISGLLILALYGSRLKDMPNVSMDIEVT